MNYFFAILALSVAAVIIVQLYSYKPKSYGKVIILNGPSTAGKSSIQREFQFLMLPNLWIKLGIDSLFDQPMPNITPENLSFWQSKNNIRWVEFTKDAHDNAVVTLYVGKEGEKVAYGMNSAIATYAKSGCNVIVDYIAYKKEWATDLRTKLKDIEAYWVKVNLPLETLEEREIARGTSPKGHGRSHYDTVHWNIQYDLEVDSSENSASEIAKHIKEQIIDNHI